MKSTEHTIADLAVNELRERNERLAEMLLKTEAERDEMKRILQKIAKAPSLGGSYRHFSRYFNIPIQLGERISEALGEEVPNGKEADEV